MLVRVLLVRVQELVVAAVDVEVTMGRNLVASRAKKMSSGKSCPQSILDMNLGCTVHMIVN